MADDTCCPVIDIRGTALVGAVQTLDAIGPQEKFINGNTSTFLPVSYTHLTLPTIYSV